MCPALDVLASLSTSELELYLQLLGSSDPVDNQYPYLGDGDVYGSTWPLGS